MRATAAVLLLLLCASQARAGDEKPAGRPASAPAGRPPPPEPVADAVLAAARAKDAPTLAALAAKDVPDPWLVADDLVRRGEHDAAEAFAKATPRVDVERLPSYVASRRGAADDPDRRERLAKANGVLATPRRLEAMEALGPAESPVREDVVGVRLAAARGFALHDLGRSEEGARVLVGAAEVAERIGWLSRAQRCLEQATEFARLGSAHDVVVDASNRRLALAQRRSDRVGAAWALVSLVEGLAELGRGPEALDAGRRAVAAWDALGEAQRAAVARANLARAHYRFGDPARAVAEAEAASRALEALGDARNAAYALLVAANAHDVLGNTAKALEIDEGLLRTFERLGDASAAARTLGNIANRHFDRGDLALSLATHERAYAAKVALGEEAEAAATLGNLGIVRQELGDLDGAAASQRRARETLVRLRDLSGAANALANLGRVEAARGNYAGAISAFEKALAEHEAIRSRHAAALTLGNLGNVHAGFGDLRKALAIQERVLAEMEDIGSEPGVEAAVTSLGSIRRALGDSEAARAAFERVLASCERRGDRGGAARARGHLGDALAAGGRFAEALAMHERSLAEKEAMGDRIGAAQTRASVGLERLATGDAAGARDACERAVEEAARLGSRGTELAALANLATVRLATGDAPGAEATARRGVETLVHYATGLSDEQGAGVRSRFGPLFATGARAAAARADADALSFFLENGRARAFLESLLGRDALRRAALPEDLRVADAEARAREAAAVAEHAAAGDDVPLERRRALKARVEAARETVRDVVARIEREAKRAADLWHFRADALAAIRARLAPDEAFVEYGLFREGSLAVVATGGGARIVALPGAGAIAAACDALALATADEDAGPGLLALRRAVVDPLALPPSATRVLVSPDGALASAPFSALLPDREVAYAPSGTVHGRLLGERPSRGEGVLALGDPDYGTRHDPAALAIVRGGRALVPLPGSGEEARAVGTVALLGAEASEPGLRRALAAHGRFRAVHFACHGLLDADRPWFSSLALTPAPGDDGFLTATEVFRTELAADLVVLSACETARGTYVAGEGVVGLMRAFLSSGAPRVICSLWKVDDEATRALMVEFYRLWNPKDGTPGLRTAQALRRAQEHVRSHERWKHPYYWAAWVLWGLPT
jgi:tetratricopeptide (TPR) repeat protein